MPQEARFFKTLLTAIFVEVRKQDAAGTKFEKMVKDVFIGAAGAPVIISGLRDVIEGMMSQSMKRKGKKIVEKGWGIAVDALNEAASNAPAADTDEEDEEDM